MHLLKRGRHNARRVSMILGLTLLCAPSAISVYARKWCEILLCKPSCRQRQLERTVLDENGEPLID